MKILALSGSLRAASYNTAMLEAMKKLAPETIEINVYKKLDNLPLFNPDLNEDETASYQDLKQCLAESQGLIIASPEYAHGISGVLKNALDWLVAGEEFVDMPLALLNASPRASHAQAALREVVTTMSGCIVDEACVSVPLLGSALDKNSMLQNKEISALLTLSLNEFYLAITKRGCYGGNH